MSLDPVLIVAMIVPFELITHGHASTIRPSGDGMTNTLEVGGMVMAPAGVPSQVTALMSRPKLVV
jgi:hypothetical protein